MTTRFHIGARELVGNISAYAKHFDLLEVRADAKAPTTAALRRWRKAVPPHFEFAVVAGPDLAMLKPSPALEQQLAAALAAVDALQARCLILPTPVDVTPSQIHRQRMATLLERVARDATHVVWEPRGVWEHDQAAAAAKRWGVVLAVDAARDEVPPGPVAYVRLRALGEQRSFGPAALERVLARVGARRDAYVILETASALAECKQLRRLGQRKRRAGEATTRVMRPRALKVRDDEQE